MVEPKIIYGCNHDLTNNVPKIASVTLERTGLDGANPSDSFSVNGKLVSINHISSHSSSNTQDGDIANCWNGDVGALYFENIDFTSSFYGDGITSYATITWLNNFDSRQPQDGERYTVSYTYLDVMATQAKQEVITFNHSSMSEYIPVNSEDIFVIYIINDKDKKFYDEVNFVSSIEYTTVDGRESACLHIEWRDEIESCEMKLKLFYYVTTSENDYSLSPSECPRCVGTNWYIDILGKKFQKATGANKLIQDIIKLLYTTPSNDGLYLSDIPGQYTYSDQKIVSAFINSIINNAVIRYSEMITIGRMNGANVTKAEQIQIINVSNLNWTDDNGIIITIKIYTMDGLSTTVTLDI